MIVLLRWRKRLGCSFWIHTTMKVQTSKDRFLPEPFEPEEGVKGKVQKHLINPSMLKVAKINIPFFSLKFDVYIY